MSGTMSSGRGYLLFVSDKLWLNTWSYDTNTVLLELCCIVTLWSVSVIRSSCVYYLSRLPKFGYYFVFVSTSSNEMAMATSVDPLNTYVVLLGTASCDLPTLLPSPGGIKNWWTLLCSITEPLNWGDGVAPDTCDTRVPRNLIFYSYPILILNLLTVSI